MHDKPMPHEVSQRMQRRLQELEESTKEIAVEFSSARILAANEPIGERVLLALYDRPLHLCF